MLDSISKQLKSRRLITTRTPYSRRDDPFLAPRRRRP